MSRAVVRALWVAVFSVVAISSYLLITQPPLFAPIRAAIITDTAEPGITRQGHARKGRPRDNRPVVTLEEAQELASTWEEKNTEVIFGLKVKKDRTCVVDEQYIPREDGTLIRGVSCTMPEDAEYDPFLDYTDNELLLQGYTDAAAAAELGRRWAYERPQEARRQMIRAAALDPANTEPLAWIAWEQFSQTGNADGSPNIEVLSERYILTRLAEDIGGESQHGLQSIVKRLQAGGLKTRGFDKLETRVRRELYQVYAVQATVPGHTMGALE